MQKHPSPTSLPLDLERSQWKSAEAAHRQRAESLTLAHRERRARREVHPVWDFLFTYYSYKPALLARWHPGAGVSLSHASETAFANRRGYRVRGSGDVICDGECYWEAYPGALGVLALIERTLFRAGRFGCFGMHEWAMIYQQEEHRHTVPLRLGQSASDAVVEAHELRCTHFDAFRFFTPAATPRNSSQLERSTQATVEQPGCLHAGMDLYKWSLKLGPLVPGNVLLDAFELARDIRQLDMEASPYDLSAWGFTAVPVETASGKAEYVRRQRDFAARGQQIRGQILASAGRIGFTGAPRSELGPVRPTHNWE